MSRGWGITPVQIPMAITLKCGKFYEFKNSFPPLLFRCMIHKLSFQLLTDEYEICRPFDMGMYDPGGHLRPSDDGKRVSWEEPVTPDPQSMDVVFKPASITRVGKSDKPALRLAIRFFVRPTHHQSASEQAAIASERQDPIPVYILSPSFVLYSKPDPHFQRVMRSDTSEEHMRIPLQPSECSLVAECVKSRGSNGREDARGSGRYSGRNGILPPPRTDSPEARLSLVGAVSPYSGGVATPGHVGTPASLGAALYGGHYPIPPNGSHGVLYPPGHLSPMPGVGGGSAFPTPSHSGVDLASGSMSSLLSRNGGVGGGDATAAAARVGLYNGGVGGPIKRSRPGTPATSEGTAGVIASARASENGTRTTTRDSSPVPSHRRRDGDGVSTLSCATASGSDDGHAAAPPRRGPGRPPSKRRPSLTALPLTSRRTNDPTSVVVPVDAAESDHHSPPADVPLDHDVANHSGDSLTGRSRRGNGVIESSGAQSKGRGEASASTAARHLSKFSTADTDAFLRGAGGGVATIGSPLDPLGQPLALQRMPSGPRRGCGVGQSPVLHLNPASLEHYQMMNFDCEQLC